MKNSHILYFVAAGLFVIAAVLSLINKNYFSAALGALAGVSFILSGIHYRRKSRSSNRG